MTLKIGIMGGTFDPIHNGHLVAAEEALVQFGLKKVIFVPAGTPPHKDGRKSLDPVERYLMCVIATASNPDFEVSRVEVDRPGPSYTVDTIRYFKDFFGRDAELFFITGADAILEIITWKDDDELAKMCRFIAATRPGYSLTKFEELHILPYVDSKTPHGRPQIDIIEVPALAISSTDIRARVKGSHPIRYLLPEGVANYILKSGFYVE